MFTGLVEAVGRIETLTGTDAGRRLSVETTLGGSLTAGDSIAVNGVCLTATSAGPAYFTADVSRHTLAVTGLGVLAVGHPVNLERPIRADARMGGHFVLGHVDGTGRIVSWRPDGEAYWLEVDIPDDLARLMIPRGSIAVDGVSLTIAALDPGRVGIQIIPYTRAHTAFSASRVGDVVNLEADVLGKYVARLLATAGAADREWPVVESQ